MRALVRKPWFLIICSFVYVLILGILVILNKMLQTNVAISKLARFETNTRSQDLIIDPSVTAEWKKETIIIAAVICSKPGDHIIRNEAEVMIKSCIISWMLFKFEADLEFHLFLEHEEDQVYLMSKIKEYGYPFPDLEIRMMFYPAMNTIPKNLHDQMQFDKLFRCMYIRWFFPSLLKNLDSVLYLDTDVIITGNLSLLWNHFGNMKGEQLVGLVQVFHEKSPETSIFFVDIPYPPPKGVASGLLLMNLTRMREYHLTDKLIQLFKDYTQVAKEMNDQKLINLLLYYDTGIWYELPCQFSFWFEHCRKDSFCEEALNDTDGIQVVQGAISRFDKGREFHELYMHYKEVNLRSATLDLKKDLIIPIKRAYELQTNVIGKEKKPYNKCYGVLDKILFKNMIAL